MYFEQVIESDLEEARVQLGHDNAWGRLVVSALIALAFTGPAPASAQQRASESEPEQTLRQALVFALSSYHGVATREDLDAFGSADEVARELRNLAQHTEIRPSMRLDAIDLLGHYDDAATVAFLEQAIDRPTTLGVEKPRQVEFLRQHAVLSYARSRGAEAVAKLAPLASAGDLQLRLTAVSAIWRHGGQAGRQRLLTLRAQIDEPPVRRMLDRFVGSASEH